MWKCLLALLLCANGGPICADEQSTDEAPRSPGDMSREERVQMMKVANDYNSCVLERAMAQVDAHGDIRRVADLAMGQCQPHLDELRATVTSWGFSEQFAQGFTRNVRSRAARSVLAALAVRSSR